MVLEEIPTPAFLVDLKRFRSNCDRMRRKAADSGVSFRPHVKTHKTLEGARIQFGGKAGPITVSTLAEAEFYAAAGFNDITYAVPIDGAKLERAAALASRVRSLNLLFDHVQALEAIEEFARARGFIPQLFLKVDSGAHRAGIDPTRPDGLELAYRAHESKFVRLVGLLTHAGHSYVQTEMGEIRQVAIEEAAVLSRMRQDLGLFDLARSIGSTPTASVVDRFPDAEEVRPGNYVFYDAHQAAIGSCSIEDCAATVLVTVIGIYPEHSKIIVDGGALAFSRDPGPVHIVDCGYGIVCSPDLKPLPARFFSMSQEHGQIHLAGKVAPGAIRIGSRLRVIPNHSCLTAAMFDRYYVVERNSVVDEWKPVRGW